MAAKESSMEESAHKVAKRNATKASLKDVNIPTESWEQAAQDQQNGAASSTKVPPNLKQRESVKLKGSVKKGKQELRDHHQTWHSPNSLALFATSTSCHLVGDAQTRY